ncbi:metallophosphoesterase family protein [Desulfospira joergensenii]|uniref:metallophosphoesterase family protein n=1 Tax=Desulfospira joergensenii TaxID=53329 RepID=UPI0003B31532|nr:metallophosphoesterase [Desulfospira joergensenii]
MKKTMDRRQFLKYGGAGLAGLGLSALNVPFFRMGKASAAISSNAWQFGVMSDTQWKSTPGGEMTCATGIIDALNEQFIQQDVKFVIQVGDLCNNESVNEVRSMPTRAEHSQALYDAGIGFFPLRGNHESSSTAANELPVLFPQTLGQGSNLYGATNFQPADISGLVGLTYSFDYNNVRCVMLDQFHRKDGTDYNGSSYNDNMVDQVDWVDAMLSSNPEGNHSFVFAHKNLIGQNHKDNLFGGGLTSNPGPRDQFLTSLYNNRVGYYMGGHDHMHHRSLVYTADGSAKVSQIITSSNSYKFYTPRSGDDGRETPLQHELYTVGYYIVTVDGPRVTVDFYSSSHGQDYGSVSLSACPSFAFYLRERFGYSLNGQQFEIAQGDSYTDVVDSYSGTTAKILDGTNGNSETDYVGRDLTKAVNTGWAQSDQVDDAASQIFTLWGMADNLSLYNGDLTGQLPSEDESQETDTYTLSLTYNPRKIRTSQLMRGNFAIAARNEDDEWVNAVDLNTGGTKTFKRGPWKSGYAVGTYGVDPSTKTVWAVLNHEGDFVAKLI